MKVFCPDPLASHPVVPFFYFRYAQGRQMGGLYRKHLPPNFFETDVVYVEKIERAEAVILPNNFLRLDADAREYIEHHAAKAESAGIPIFVFSFGDLTHHLRFDPRVYVFRLSMYRSTCSPRDVIAPTLVDDPGAGGVSIRSKAAVPVVSFCGQATYRKPAQWVRYGVKVAFFNVVGLFRPSLRARIVGVYWRRKAIRACLDSDIIQTNFIVRGSFSGARSTVEIPPEDARRQFIENVRESDFVLAPKGDGNYSNRFLEALAMGRIPVVIDTDTVLPFEDRIPYSDICVRVPMRDIARIPEHIRRFYDTLSDEEWAGRQQKARDVFEQKLRQDVAVKNALTALCSPHA